MAQQALGNTTLPPALELGVQIDLWSDYACPWCALGVYRLDQARQKFAHGDEITVVHRSFELDPNAPAHRTQSMDEMLASKYGMSPDQIRAGHERLTALGHEVGMEFHFEKIQMGSTFDAHRLTQAARALAPEAEEALVKRLFAAYFTNGELLSDHEVLLRAAIAAGMDGDLAAGVLAGSDHMTDVREDEAVAQELGITGVPYFLFNGKWAVPGAQDVDTLVLALGRAWERTEGLAQAGSAAT
jgi:predicted DsbA family dithiol-disulfide isomerase